MRCGCRFLLRRDQLALLDHDEGGDVGALVEELGGGKDQHAVLLGDEEKAVLREADAVRDGEGDRGRELLDLVGDAILVAVGDRPHLAFARADERHHALRPDGDVAGIRNDGIEPDLEPARQLDAGEILLDRVGLRAGLRYLRDVHRRAGGLEVGQLFEIARGRRLRHSRPSQHQCRGDAQQRVFHVFLPSSHCLLSLKHPMHHPTFFPHAWLFWPAQPPRNADRKKSARECRVFDHRQALGHRCAREVRGFARAHLSCPHPCAGARSQSAPASSTKCGRKQPKNSGG